MEGGEDFDFVTAYLDMPSLASKARYGQIVAQDDLGSQGAQTNNSPGGHQLNLPVEVIRTLFKLAGLGISVFGWAALNEVGQIDLLTRVAHGHDHLA